MGLKSKNRKYLRVCGVLWVVLLCCSLICGCGNGLHKETAPSTGLELPWQSGGKQPSEYTWEEFENLNGSLRVAFQQSFGSMEEFNQWMMTAKGVNTQSADPEAGYDLELPWENGGKQPAEYTWEEFLALDGGLQIAFQRSFGSYEEFSWWMLAVNGDQVQTMDPEEEIHLELPWENGGKQPSEYTWEEFDSLDGGLQIAFQKSFGSYEDFDAWLQKQGHADATEPADEEVAIDLPWENGGKQPSEYTWAEFEALEGGQQIAFQQSFGRADLFEAWMDRVNGGSTEATEYEEESTLYLPWEHGGKQPAEYTWEEFTALEGGQQMAFQNSFGSREEFDEWFQRVNPQ